MPAPPPYKRKHYEKNSNSNNSTIPGGGVLLEQKQAHRQAQVEMVRTQVEARNKAETADASARAALYAAMAKVAESSPEVDAIAVAMAVSAVREEQGSDQPIVQLQRETNEAAEVAKAIAPSLITTLGTVAIAGYQASVNKTQSDNSRSGHC